MTGKAERNRHKVRNVVRNAVRNARRVHGGDGDNLL